MFKFLSKIFGDNESRVNKRTFRILFTTDIHGSNTCFKKFINTVNNTKLSPDVLIIGGDITGKDLTYLVEQPDGSILTSDRGKTIKLTTKEEIEAFIKKVGDGGGYIYKCTIEDYNQVTKSKEKQDNILKGLIEERIQEWINLAEKKLANSEVPLIINTGNDDFYSIDKLLSSSDKIIFPEGKIVPLKNGTHLVSCGYANLTPFGCPRDISEENLFNRIESYLNEYLNKGLDMNNCILNLHCPPINSKLDIGPKLVDGTQPKMSAFGKEIDAVGSEAIRDIIEKYQPLLGLHGHIHESPNIDFIGKTQVLNPGSEYQSGILRFAIIDFNEIKLLKSYLRTAM